MLTEFVAALHECRATRIKPMHDADLAGDDTWQEKLVSYRRLLPAECVAGNVSNSSDSARRPLTIEGSRQSEATIMA